MLVSDTFLFNTLISMSNIFFSDLVIVLLFEPRILTRIAYIYSFTNADNPISKRFTFIQFMVI